MQEIINILKTFRDERDWEQFHNPKDLAIAISIEANELMELFLWKDQNSLTDVSKEKIGEELADIFAFSLLLLDKYNLDLEEIILNKIKSNARKYPVEKSKGRADKYDQL